MRRLSAVSSVCVLVATLLSPLAAQADQRCTPIAHVIDASQIPGNASSHPGSSNPDERYHDAAGLNCIPTYEIDFSNALNDPAIPKGQCVAEGPYDQAAMAIQADPKWLAACKRLKFTMGPLIARPGMNDTMVHLTTFEHPMYSGYAIRWKPGLQAVDGTVPPVEELHLHHGTWIGGYNGPTAATGPFFATGEEQTILQYPKGYGWHWAGDSAWAMIYMLHNALPSSKAVYITYDIDFIADTDATSLGGLKDTRSLWLDVGGSGGNAMTTDGKDAGLSGYSPLNPVFNAQKGFGHEDTGAFWGLTNTDGSTLTSVPVRNNFGTGKKVCYYPRENCSAFNSAQGVTAQQGLAKTNIVGTRVSLANALSSEPCPGIGKKCGVLVNMGGHLHPGGLRDEVSILRGDKIIPIHISDAVYWGGDNYGDPTSGSAPPKSWDLSMTGTLGYSAGTGRDKDAWKVLFQQGDTLILNGIYDTSVGSAYDQMGIVMSWAHPGFEPDAIDPFDPNTIVDAGWTEGPALTPRPPGLPAEIDHGCTPGTIRSGDADAGASDENVGKTVLCLRGNVTHGSMPSRQHHWDCSATATCAPLPAQRMPLMNTEITMQGYNYGQMDAAAIATAGVPTIARGTTLTFYNPDTAGAFWHTVTSCEAPCTGQTSASYPYPAAGNAKDFDSAVLCVGLGCATQGVLKWTYTPTDPGLYTFFCRIHPWMRGAFDVT